MNNRVVVITGPAPAEDRNTCAAEMRGDPAFAVIDIMNCATTADVRTSLQPYGSAPLRAILFYVFPKHCRGDYGVRKWIDDFMDIVKIHSECDVPRNIPKVAFSSSEADGGLFLKCLWDTVDAEAILEWLAILDKAYLSWSPSIGDWGLP